MSVYEWVSEHLATQVMYVHGFAYSSREGVTVQMGLSTDTYPRNSAKPSREYVRECVATSALARSRGRSAAKGWDVTVSPDHSLRGRYSYTVWAPNTRG